MLALLNTSQYIELHLGLFVVWFSCVSSCWTNTCGITISPWIVLVSINIGSFGGSGGSNFSNGVDTLSRSSKRKEKQI